MVDLGWATWIKVLVAAFAGLVFLGCLLGILITGPVVVRPPRIEVREAQISVERLRSTVDLLCNELAPRDFQHQDNLDRIAAWIETRFREAGLEVETQEYELAEGRFRNVVARRAGSDPDAGAVVIGAHYDAYRDFPGADDNASGVAVLVEMVRHLEDATPRATHYFVAFSTEEPPFFSSDKMGSAVFARQLAERGVTVNLMVALDLVGYYSDEPGSQRFPVVGLGLLYPDTANFVAVVGDLGAGRAIRWVKQRMMAVDTIPVRSFRAPAAIPGVNWSDNLPFRQRGWPAVLVTDTAFMRFAHYHTIEDTPDRLDYERMAAVTRALLGVLWEPSVSD